MFFLPQLFNFSNQKQGSRPESAKTLDQGYGIE
jgi:hypothetical protein